MSTGDDELRWQVAAYIYDDAVTTVTRDATLTAKVAKGWSQSSGYHHRHRSIVPRWLSSSMSSFLRHLALIRRLYALGTFLRSRLKFLLCILCRKLTSWLMTVRATTRRLGYSEDVVASRKAK